MNYKDLKILIWPFVIVICLAFFFAFALPLRADTSMIDAYYASSTCGGTISTWTQGFTASSTNIANISLVIKNGSAVYLDLYICKGPIDASTTTAKNRACLGNAQQVIKYEHNIFLATSSTYRIVKFEFEPAVLIVGGVNYYYTFVDYSDTATLCYANVDHYKMGCVLYMGGAYAGNCFANPAGLYDLSFRINYDETWYPTGTGDENPTGNYDYSLEDYRSDINTVNYQVCWLEETCNLWFSFNQKAIGKKVYTTPDIVFQQWPAFSIASTTIRATPLWQNKVILPATTTEQKKDYCLYMVDSVYGDLRKCGITIDYLASSTFDDIFPISQYDIEHVCDSIATSTGSILDDIRYGIECAARKTVYWLFIPNKESISGFVNNAAELKKVVPFNLYFDLADKAGAAIASTTTSGNDTFGIPFVNASGSIYILPVISSTSMPRAIGQTNTNTFRMTIGYLMWTGLAIGIFFIIF